MNILDNNLPLHFKLSQKNYSLQWYEGLCISHQTCFSLILQIVPVQPGLLHVRVDPPKPNRATAIGRLFTAQIADKQGVTQQIRESTEGRHDVRLNSTIDAINWTEYNGGNMLVPLICCHDEPVRQYTRSNWFRPICDMWEYTTVN